MKDAYTPNTLPNAAGVGYKPQHFADLLKNPGAVKWLEIHAENYMGDGGRPIAQLRHLSQEFPISVHGVGLSIGGKAPLDKTHLGRLAHLLDWLAPASFSEHLAWSTHEGMFYNDLLPLPYTNDTLQIVCDHIDEVQNRLGLQLLLENPSSYLSFTQSTWQETDFLREVTRRTGCGLLLDVNNVFISAQNLGFTPQSYIDNFPLSQVGEIHLGGHDAEEDAQGVPLLIDSHGCEVSDPVWALLSYTLTKSGAKPTLIEWDTDVPDWQTLEAEAQRAAQKLQLVTS